jgi:hypothetical protein
MAQETGMTIDEIVLRGALSVAAAFLAMFGFGWWGWRDGGRNEVPLAFSFVMGFSIAVAILWFGYGQYLFQHGASE